jgi:hypothetical protein
MSFAPTIRRMPGVFYQDISGTTLGLRGLGAAAPAATWSPGDPPLPQDVTDYPFGKYSAQTLQLQNALNVLLIKHGFCPLIADGKLGARTCGAGISILNDIGRSGIDDTPNLPTMQQSPARLAPTTCGDMAPLPRVTDPGGCGTGPSAPALTPAELAAQQAAANTASSVGFSLTSGTTLAIGAGVIALIGIIYYVKR